MLYYSFILAEELQETLLVETETRYASETMELLEQLEKHPLNLNYATRSELLQLPWFSEYEVDQIIEYRREHSFQSWKELQKFDLDSLSITEMKKFIDFKTQKPVDFRQRTRVEFKEADENVRSSLKYYQRTLLNYDRIQIGFLSEKDQAESDPIDYYSYFINYQNESVLRNIILGKYRLALGQGILFAPKLGLSKSSATTSAPQKKFRSIKPYTSSYEMWDMEGFSAEVDLGNLLVIPYYSKTKLNANLDPEENKITSFDLSGLNYDETEKDNITETISGAASYYYFTRNYLGMNFHKINFSKQFLDSSKKHDYFAWSLDLLWYLNGFPVFSEFAIAEDKTAFVSGIKLSQGNLRQLLLFRRYEKNFPTWHGKPFSAQSNFDNETGFYYGLSYRPAVGTRINCYFDLWRYPKTRYYEKMPTVGSEQYIQFNKKLGDQGVQISLQHKDKEKYINLDDAKIRRIKRTTVRTDWSQKFADIRFKTRLEFVSEWLPEEENWEKGFLTYQQIKFTHRKLETIFQIAAVHSRVLHYMYEYSVDGLMQNSVMNEDDLFYFLVLKYRLSRVFELQFKYSDFWSQKDSMKLYFQLISTF